MRLSATDVHFGYGGSGGRGGPGERGGSRGAGGAGGSDGPGGARGSGRPEGSGRFEGSPGPLVLSGVNLTYESPGVLCILGTNGTGKSTLLRTLIGELRPSRGVVELDGRPVGSYRPVELARRFAYLPQVHAPSFSYAVIDVVLMGRTSRIGYLASPGASDVAFAYEQLAYLGIEHLAERPYTEISGGERQLVMIASALAQEPEALLLDEPTAHLDFGNQYRFLELVERLRDRGIGVLMTTHYPDHALLLDCPTAVLAAGRIQVVGPAREVVTDEVMSRVYGIEVTVAHVGDRATCIPGPLWRKGGLRDGDASAGEEGRASE